MLFGVDSMVMAHFWQDHESEGKFSAECSSYLSSFFSKTMVLMLVQPPSIDVVHVSIATLNNLWY